MLLNDDSPVAWGYLITLTLTQNVLQMTGLLACALEIPVPTHNTVFDVTEWELDRIFEEIE